jgi:hypothetical protein
MINFNTMANNPENPENAENSKDADRADLRIKIVADSDPAEVFADPTPYFPGAEKIGSMTLANFLHLFQKVAHASTHFTMDGAGDAYEHITQQHVRDIMTAYGPHLKANDNASKTFTFGDEFRRILSNVALTMESWNRGK